MNWSELNADKSAQHIREKIAELLTQLADVDRPLCRWRRHGEPLLGGQGVAGPSDPLGRIRVEIWRDVP